MIDHQSPNSPDVRSRGVAHAPVRLEREGPILIANKGAELPRRCIRCNMPGVGEALTQKLVTSKALPNGLIGATVHLATRQATTVKYYLCAKHRAARARVLAIDAFLILGGSVLTAFSLLRLSNFSTGAAVAFGIGGAFLMAGLILSQTSRLQPLRARAINDDFVLMTGAGPAFLDSIHPE